MSSFFFFKAVVGAFHKFTIGESHGPPSPIKVIMIMMQNDMDFQGHVQVEIFIKVEEVHLEMVKYH